MTRSNVIKAVTVCCLVLLAAGVFCGAAAAADSAKTAYPDGIYDSGMELADTIEKMYSVRDGGVSEQAVSAVNARSIKKGPFVDEHLFSSADVSRMAEVKRPVATWEAATANLERNYGTKMDKKNNPDRMDLNKYSKFTQMHKPHREFKASDSTDNVIYAEGRPSANLRGADFLQQAEQVTFERGVGLMSESLCLNAHDEEDQNYIGDTVEVMETRPLSKDKRWRITQIDAWLTAEGESAFAE